MKHITPQTLKTLLTKKPNAVVVDLRSPVQFRDWNYPRSINAATMTVLSTMQRYPKTTPIVLYGESSKDTTLNISANYLEQMGYTEIYSTEGADRLKASMSTQNAKRKK